MNTWTLQDAKARFSEVVRRARAGEPQHVTVHGEAAVVVIPVEDFVPKPQAQRGEEFIAAMRQVILDDDIVFERIDCPALPRPIVLPDD